MATIDGHAVEINDATESAARGWFEVLASQWVLLKDGDNRELEGDGALLSRRILAGDPLFTALYREADALPVTQRRNGIPLSPFGGARPPKSRRFLD